MAYIAPRKNVRICQVYYNRKYYDLTIGISTLDDVDTILEQWALQEFGIQTGTMPEPVLPVALDLPEALVSNQNLSEILTSLNLDNYVYMVSGT